MFIKYSIEYLQNAINDIQKQKANRVIVEPKPKKVKSKKSKCPYYKKVWTFTIINSIKLKDIDKRGFKSYHIDHIVPISYGKKNNICPTKIGSLENIRMIYYKDNMRKGDRLTIEGFELLKFWGYEISKD
jgi:hypothetical protein